MKGYAGSKTVEKNRDMWQTPKFVFDHYNKLFKFTHDVAASHSNHLCDEYFTVDDDGLSRDWGTVNWLNPPVNNNNIGSVVFVFGTAGKSVSLIHRDSMKG